MYLWQLHCEARLRCIVVPVVLIAVVAAVLRELNVALVVRHSLAQAHTHGTAKAKKRQARGFARTSDVLVGMYAINLECW